MKDNTCYVSSFPYTSVVLYRCLRALQQNREVEASLFVKYVNIIYITQYISERENHVMQKPTEKLSLLQQKLLDAFCFHCFVCVYHLQPSQFCQVRKHSLR